MIWHLLSLKWLDRHLTLIESNVQLGGGRKAHASSASVPQKSASVFGRKKLCKRLKMAKMETRVNAPCIKMGYLFSLFFFFIFIQFSVFFLFFIIFFHCSFSLILRENETYVIPSYLPYFQIVALVFYEIIYYYFSWFLFSREKSILQRE